MRRSTVRKYDCTALLSEKTKTEKEFQRDYEKHTKRIRFRVTSGEFATIQQKQKEVNIISREEFPRRMIMEGKILKLEIPELREISILLGRYAKQSQSNGPAYQQHRVIVYRGAFRNEARIRAGGKHNQTNV